MRAVSTRGGSLSGTHLCALLAVLLLCSREVSAYGVRYATVTSKEGVQMFNSAGYCPKNDAAAHAMMPREQSFQNMAMEKYRSAGFSSFAPLGGVSRQASCLDEACKWQFNTGLYTDNQFTFYNGIIIAGQLKGGPEPGVYNNFDGTNYPAAWENTSYWGNRQPAMDTSGQWVNLPAVTYFNNWVCEYYEYKKSDSVFFPTYPNGDPIVPPLNPNDTFVHCGHDVKVDSKGRWYDKKCGSSFPWWAGLIIAVGAAVIVFVVIIVVACCCCYCRNSKETEKREADLDTFADNPSHVPSQSQLGMSRTSAYSSFDDDRMEESSYE